MYMVIKLVNNASVLTSRLLQRRHFVGNIRAKQSSTENWFEKRWIINKFLVDLTLAIYHCFVGNKLHVVQIAVLADIVVHWMGTTGTEESVEQLTTLRHEWTLQSGLGTESFIL